MVIKTEFKKKDLKLMKKTFMQFKGRILDIGCGNLLDRIGFTPGNEYIGADIERKKYTSLFCDIHFLPIKNEKFDGLICNAVLEHLYEPEIALKECNRVLKVNGKLWLSVPFLQHIHSNYDYRRFTDQGLRYEVEKAGFCLDEIYGSYGVLNNIEYLIFAAIGWRIVKEKDYNINSLIYICVLSMLFMVTKIFGIIFSSQQIKDIHHATNYTIIPHKVNDKYSN